MKALITTICLCAALLVPKQDAEAQISSTKQKTNRFGFHPVHELGVILGANQQRSDINNMYVIDFSSVNIAAGLYYRYTFHHRFAISTTAMYYRLEGADRFVRDKEVYSNGWFRYIRNLSYRTDLVEVALNGEFHILKYEPFETRKMRWTPYVSAGFGGVYFNPKGYFQGEWYNLQPLGTEGQGLAGYPAPYSRFTWAGPLKGGVKINLSKFMSLNAFVGYTFTGTDYLDDLSTVYPKDFNKMSYLSQQLSARADEVSSPEVYANIIAPGTQRGNSMNKDGYWITGVSLSFKIGGLKKGPTSCVKWEREKSASGRR
ncbi:hypothetical protein BH09BAC1_BH09BAC1_15500 [soil metagenome]